MEFIIRWRVLPIRIDGNELQLGFTDDPEPALINRVRQNVPGVIIKPVHISARYFNDAIAKREAQTGQTGAYDAISSRGGLEGIMSFEELVRRMAALGASDLRQRMASACGGHLFAARS